MKKLYNRMKKFLFDSDARFSYFSQRGFYKNVPDDQYLKRLFKIRMGYELDLNNPKTFNEKLQWLKLYDRKKDYTVMVDKYEAKEYVKNLIGEEFIIPTLQLCERFEDINFDILPDQFVIKTTHDSGGYVVVTDKAKLDKAAAKKKINKSLKRNFYYNGREWPYKNVKPRIIVEKFIGEANKQPEDYKILCFNGKPDNVMVCVERETGTTKFYFFDLDWNLLRYNGWGINAPENFTLPKPSNYEKMFKIAKVLSKDIPVVRIDLYNVNGKIYFGEITFYPDSGFDNRLLKETDSLFGEKIQLPFKYFK